MATGDSTDILGRLKGLIPPGWFAVTAPLRDAVLGGLADDGAAQFALLQVVRAATRIAKTAGWLLDIVAWDFFGARLARLDNEPDAAFRTRFIAEIFRERATRKGISGALKDLTGRAPAIFDPAAPRDSGGYGVPVMGYGVAGAYGSLALPNQVFVTAFRPSSNGIPYISGYGKPAGGYGIGAISYADTSQIKGVLTDAVITDRVESVVASGVNPNLSISN